jgi:hypothetical protein
MGSVTAARVAAPTLLDVIPVPAAPSRRERGRPDDQVLHRGRPQAPAPHGPRPGSLVGRHRWERQAASSALSNRLPRGPRSGCRGLDPKRGQVSGRGSRAYYPCRGSPGSRRRHPRSAAPVCVHPTPRHRGGGLCSAVYGRTLHGGPSPDGRRVAPEDRGAHRCVPRALDQGHAPHRRARAPRCRGGSTTSQGSA